MSRLEIVLMAVISLSAIFNLLVFVYAREAITRLLTAAEEFGDLKEMTDSFSTHLKGVYELDMFYGDQTLSSLMDHATSYNEYLGTFEHIYQLTETEETEEETTDGDSTFTG